jgi:putative transcriptional regulator
VALGLRESLGIGTVDMNRTAVASNLGDETPRICLAGYLMVAAPGVQDPVFSRSVCIIVEHSEERTIGIMLNRPMAIDTAPLWQELFEGTEKPLNAISHVNFGGPQNGPVLAIHDNKHLAEGGNSEGVYLSAQAETLKKIAQVTPEHCRLFVGHAVWQVSQLETEIVNGDWHVLPAIPELVFADEPSMWARGIQAVGNGVILSATGLPSVMKDVTLN